MLDDESAAQRLTVITAMFASNRQSRDYFKEEHTHGCRHLESVRAIILYLMSDAVTPARTPSSVSLPEPPSAVSAPRGRVRVAMSEAGMSSSYCNGCGGGGVHEKSGERAGVTQKLTFVPQPLKWTLILDSSRAMMKAWYQEPPESLASMCSHSTDDASSVALTSCKPRK